MHNTAKVRDPEPVATIGELTAAMQRAGATFDRLAASPFPLTHKWEAAWQGYKARVKAERGKPETPQTRGAMVAIANEAAEYFKREADEHRAKDFSTLTAGAVEDQSHRDAARLSGQQTVAVNMAAASTPKWSVEGFLAELGKRGMQVSPGEKGTLVVRPAALLLPADRERLLEHKEAIIALLHAGSVTL